MPISRPNATPRRSHFAAIDFGQSRSCGFVPLSVAAHRKDGNREALWASE